MSLFIRVVLKFSPDLIKSFIVKFDLKRANWFFTAKAVKLLDLRPPPLPPIALVRRERFGSARALPSIFQVEKTLIRVAIAFGRSHAKLGYELGGL